jgi:hypothetical protein
MFKYAVEKVVKKEEYGFRIFKDLGKSVKGIENVIYVNKSLDYGSSFFTNNLQNL